LPPSPKSAPLNPAEKPACPAGRSALPAPVFHDSKHHIKIYQGDCLEILAAIPEACVDMIFADPPYFLSNGGITCHAGRMVSVHKGDWDRSRGADANHEFNRAWLAACRRVLKPNGTVWVSGTAHVIHSVGFAMQQLGYKLLNDISWVKPNPPPNLSCRYFTHATETIIWAARDQKSRHTFHYKLMREHAGGKQMKSVWEILPPAREEKRFGKHPTQKPIALVERILLASTNPGDLVLDPFLGGGTTAIAALRLARFTTSVEQNAAFVDLALSRLVGQLILVHLKIGVAQIDLDLRARSVDRSVGTRPRAMTTEARCKLVRAERSFYFIGANPREVVFSVAANNLEDAWHAFRASSRDETEVLFVVKAETEIYLAQ
jgi:site-specific DNA-methyltransferase (adenine-specific)